MPSKPPSKQKQRSLTKREQREQLQQLIELREFMLDASSLAAEHTPDLEIDGKTCQQWKELDQAELGSLKQKLEAI